MKKLIAILSLFLLVGCVKEVPVYKNVYICNIIYFFDSKVTNPATGKPYKDPMIISNELNRQINTNNHQCLALQEAHNAGQ